MMEDHLSSSSESTFSPSLATLAARAHLLRENTCAVGRLLQVGWCFSDLSNKVYDMLCVYCTRANLIPYQYTTYIR